MQQKTLAAEKSKHPALSKEKIEQRVMDKLNVFRLTEKPREYKVKFDFKSADDHGSVSLRDVDFLYEKRGEDGEDGNGVSSFSGFKNLNFDFDSSFRACIVGANGSGKSTLLKLLAGQLQPTRGERLIGQRVKIGFYDQHFSELLDDGSSHRRRPNAVQILLERYPTLLNGSQQEARQILGRFGLDSERHMISVDDLSGGQKARVVLASLSLKQPHVMLLDEPTNHLDIESIDALIDGLKSWKGGVLAVTHDAALVDALSHDSEGIEQPLYVCESSSSGTTTIRLERGGLDKYRLDLQKKQEVREAQIARELVLRAERRKKANKLPAPPKKCIGFSKFSLVFSFVVWVSGLGVARQM